MNDILIRGMEMPDGCHHCRFSYLDKGETNDGEPCSVIMCSAMEQGTNGAEYDGNRPSWCPLVPLPEGHGRLIDADEIVAEMEKKETELDKIMELCKRVGDMENYFRCSNNQTEIVTFVRMLKNAPTIVPAEGWTDDG